MISEEGTHHAVEDPAGACSSTPGWHNCSGSYGASSTSAHSWAVDHHCEVVTTRALFAVYLVCALVGALIAFWRVPEWPRYNLLLAIAAVPQIGHVLGIRISDMFVISVVAMTLWCLCNYRIDRASAPERHLPAICDNPQRGKRPGIECQPRNYRTLWRDH